MFREQAKYYNKGPCGGVLGICPEDHRQNDYFSKTLFTLTSKKTSNFYITDITQRDSNAELLMVLEDSPSKFLSKQACWWNFETPWVHVTRNRFYHGLALVDFRQYLWEWHVIIIQGALFRTATIIWSSQCCWSNLEHNGIINHINMQVFTI